MRRPVPSSPVHWIVAGLVTTAVAAAGTLLTNLGPWYFDLVKPSWQPPDWLFGPVWTVVFACTAWSGALAWTAADAAARPAVAAAYALNGVLNVGWSLLFFTLRRPDWAFIEAFALWGSIVAMIVVARPWSVQAAWLLVPYLVWVSFATVLTRAVSVRNRPFGRGR